MIKVVDYGLGNVSAFLTMYKRLNIEAQAARHADELQGASRIVLPGVGSFDHAMQALQRSGMRPLLDELVLEKHTPVLGICVGMQMLADGSDEGSERGLGWVPGRVKAFQSLDLPNQILPHMGWNDVQPQPGPGLFEPIDSPPRFYFLHSFYFECRQAEHIAAQARYGIDFCCAVRAGHVHGVQFHPEKSHHFGAQLLKNFAEL